MIRKLALALLATAGFFMTGCIQMDQKTTINPDGSGKLDIKATLDLGPLMGLMQQQGGENAKADPSHEMLVGILAQTKGIDVWKDAKSVKGADGKLTVTATGYFKDISKVQSGNPMSSLGGGGKSEMPEMGQFKSSKDADGNWILEVPLDLGGKKEAGEKPQPKEKMNDEEIEAKVEEMRQQFGAMKPMMEQMLGGMKIKNSIEVGGTIKDSGLFTKVDDKTASLELSFGKMFTAMEALIKDDAVAKKLAQAGGSNPMEMLGSEDPEMKEIGKKMLGAMVGGKGEPRIVVKPGEPVFDYAAEAEKAKAGQSAELKKLLKEAEEKAKNGGNGAEEKEEEAADPKKKAA